MEWSINDLGHDAGMLMVLLPIVGYVFGAFFISKDVPFIAKVIILIAPAYFAVGALQSSNNSELLMVFYALGFWAAIRILREEDELEHAETLTSKINAAAVKEQKAQEKAEKYKPKKTSSALALREEQNDLKQRQHDLELRRRELEIEKREFALLQKEEDYEQQRNLVSYEGEEQEDYLTLPKPDLRLSSSQTVATKLLPKSLLRIIGK